MLFEAIVGQQAAKDRLHSLLISLQTQFILLAGPEGIGKKTLAEAFAKGMLCPQTGDHPAEDQSCAACRYFEAGVHPDMIRLFPDVPGKQIPVERVRREVIADTMTLPQMGRHKLYLIDSDGLNEQGQNALLKTLEEPPPHCFFILLSSEPRRLLDTIRSRATVITLERSTLAELMQILKSRGIAVRTEAATVARYADGLPGVALRLAEDEWFADTRAALLTLTESLMHGSRTSVLLTGYPLFEENKDRLDDLFDMLEIWLRDLLVRQQTQSAELLVNQDQADRLAALCAEGRWRPDTVSGALGVIGEVRRALSANGNFEICIHHLLLQLRKELTNV